MWTSQTKFELWKPQHIKIFKMTHKPLYIAQTN